MMMMKKLLFTFLGICFLQSGLIKAQTSPYALSPRWYFGNRAGLDFTSGAPVFLSGGQTNSLMTIEGSSTICDPTGSVAFYSDGYSLYDGNNVFIQNTLGGTSSTQNSVCIPDPASPATRFYLFTANVDDGGGGDKPAVGSLGIHYYHIQKTATSITVLTGPVKIANHNEVTEQICSGVDGNGGYWVVAHEGGNYGWQNWHFRAWHITTGGVSPPVISRQLGNYGNNPWQGSIKINQCQDKIANVLSSSQVIEIYTWNQTTGAVDAMPRQVTGVAGLYGCEFSPDGNILYYSGIGTNRLYQMDLSTGSVYTDPAWTSSNNTTEIGTMQLGPDGKIYVTNVSTWGTPVYIGVVNNPNVLGAGCNYNKTGFLLNAGPATYPNINRGIANISWLQPNQPVINNTLGCMSITFDFDFQDYFNQDITVEPGSEEWNFGDGTGFHSGLGATPTYTYPAEGPYTVTVRFRDLVCGKTWTSTKSISVDCALPVNFLFVDATYTEGRVEVVWATTTAEDNTHFVISRSSDGVLFEDIGTVNVTGTSSTITSYSFMDKDPSSGNVYYQVREITETGTSSSSQTVSVLSEEINCLLFPNPSQSEFRLIFSGANEGIVQVYDMLGREVYKGKLDHDMSFGNHFVKGKYIVKVTLPDQVIVKEIIKE
jgi:hypothetical protein